MVDDTNELFTQDLKYEEFRSTIIDRRVNMEHVESITTGCRYIYFSHVKFATNHPHASSLEILISCGKQRQKYCPPRR